MTALRSLATCDALSTGPRRGISLATGIIPSVSHRAQVPDLNPSSQQRRTVSNSSREYIQRRSLYSPASHRNIPHRHKPTQRSFLNNQVFYSTQIAPSPTIHNIFEPVTGTWQYIVSDESSRVAVIIDPVLDYDQTTQAITTQSADSLLSLIKEKGYKVERILETHAHADHLTAASYLQKKLTELQGFQPSIGIGKRIEKVQKLFGQQYGLPSEEYETVFDKLFEDDEVFSVGSLSAKAIHLPGHTPDHLGYQIGDNVFCGDSLFHTDIGTARCDFPGGDARDLYRSSRKLLALDEHVKIWPGHDYPPDGRDSPIACMSVADHKKQNKHVAESVLESDFVAMRTERDAKLNAPRLLHPSLQINIRAGKLPRPLNSGHRMLHLPLKLNGLEW
ncbi:metallo-beta-lactamase domain protein [Penicillium herquei]|nr:metallo-beta-lactamase domain protein [Penicillium herquei]